MAPLLPLLLAALAPTPDAAVRAALAPAGAEVEVRAVRATANARCPAERWEAMRPVEASGQVPLRFTGREPAGARCEGFAWADVRVSGPALRLARDVAADEPLAGAVEAAVAELLPARRPVAALPAGALAARRLRAGAPLLEADLRVGPRSGDPVAVVVRAGALELEQSGRAVPCPKGRACALLPGGRRVEGRLEAGRVVVEVP
jgi:hypothetical protein